LPRSRNRVRRRCRPGSSAQQKPQFLASRASDVRAVAAHRCEAEAALEGGPARAVAVQLKLRLQTSPREQLPRSFNRTRRRRRASAARAAAAQQKPRV
jgi:hypothetical protein